MRVLKTIIALTKVAFAIEVAPLKNLSTQGVAAAKHTAVVTARKAVEDKAEAVQALRSKLEKMASGLQAMEAAMAKSTIGPELQTFAAELHAVLKETRGMKDNAAAMKKLLAAREGIASLTHDLTARQVDIMKDEEAQRNSLLLSVLMMHQKEPMAEQLKLLTSDDLAMLPVSKALLAKHNSSEPLFRQAAAYLDTHVTKGIKIKAKTEADIKAEHAATAARLQKSVDSLQKIYDGRVKSHTKREQELAASVKQAKSKKDQHVLQVILKREERNFKKWAAMQKHDIEAMEAAVAAVKKGDASALSKAKDALQQSIAGLKNKNQGFLVLLSLGHELLERDCPYCAAQCVDSCHEAGKPYTTCLTDCADAGRGK